MQKLIDWIYKEIKRNRYKTNVLFVGVAMWLVILLLWLLGVVQ